MKAPDRFGFAMERHGTGPVDGGLFTLGESFGDPLGRPKIVAPRAVTGRLSQLVRFATVHHEPVLGTPDRLWLRHGARKGGQSERDMELRKELPTRWVQPLHRLADEKPQARFC